MPWKETSPMIGFERSESRTEIVPAPAGRGGGQSYLRSPRCPPHVGTSQAVVVAGLMHHTRDLQPASSGVANDGVIDCPNGIGL
jgi:hypothetical protein